jgi:hypothetical protein
MPLGTILFFTLQAAFFVFIAVASLSGTAWAIIFPVLLLVACLALVRTGRRVSAEDEREYLRFLRETILAVPVPRQ